MKITYLTRAVYLCTEYSMYCTLGDQLETFDVIIIYCSVCTTVYRFDMQYNKC